MDTAHLRQLAEGALNEVRAVFTALTSEATETLVAEVQHARRIALYGVGREGLMMKAFAMRLFHLGLEANVVGDMTTPRVGEGDLLIVSAGPGQFSTVLALMGVARESGARSVVVTAQPGGAAATAADAVVHLPAQTMADDLAGAPSVLPMGSLYETAQLIFFELVVILLRDRLGETAESMRGRHTNLE
jgi:6-phospho-3-hexuloisomerase